MTAYDLIDNLTGRGVILQPAGDRLTYDAPEGELTDTDFNALRAHKPDILAILSARAPIEFDASHMGDFYFLAGELRGEDFLQIMVEADAAERAGESREEAELRAVKAWIQRYRARRLRAGSGSVRLLVPEPGGCPGCGRPAELQDRALNAWRCANCRRWFDSAGQPLPSSKRARPLTAEDAAARRLAEDLRAAGCSFILDGEELRVRWPKKISASLWARFEAAGPALAAIVRLEAI